LAHAAVTAAARILLEYRLFRRRRARINVSV